MGQIGEQREGVFGKKAVQGHDPDGAGKPQGRGEKV